MSDWVKDKKYHTEASNRKSRIKKIDEKHFFRDIYAMNTLMSPLKLGLMLLAGLVFNSLIIS